MNAPGTGSAPRKAVVIGAGASGLAGAAVLARHGWHVTVLERNAQVGGRMRTWHSGGFSFDMGPSFYWMPEVFEHFFSRFGGSTADHYELRRLDPSYRVLFADGAAWDLPAGPAAVAEFFERREPGAGGRLRSFLAEAALKYRLSMGQMVHAPSLSWREYMQPSLLAALARTRVLGSWRAHIARHFADPGLRRVLEFPALFLGAAPQHVPALYSMMNHADIAGGTWYPMGGFGRVAGALGRVAGAQGAAVRTGDPVRRIVLRRGKVAGVEAESGFHPADVVLASADYHHVENALLPAEARGYSDRYWAKRRMAPSALLFFLGLDTKLPGAEHHTLFFDADLDAHTADIFTRHRWPRQPLFHLCCPSRTDPSCAPPGCEAVVVLVPIASGSRDDAATREHGFRQVADRLQQRLGIDVRKHLRVQRSYCVNDFAADHNAFLGNAYGLASTLAQTGPLRPRMKSRKVRGLYFSGQLTVPGPGLPTALISGQVAADLILREHPLP